MKSIILCADGTWNTPHGIDPTRNDTNVRKLYCALKSCSTQLKYYDSGVGTDGTPIDHLSGGAMGEGLFQKIQDCYSFLSNVHDPGDKIYVFGFSRGAFTARCVGGMIAGFGVPTINLDNETVPKIFAAYREPDPDKKQLLKADLNEAYALTPVNVQMMGVWDTVGALGIPGIFFNLFNQKKYGFLDTAIHPDIAHGCHAVSIDERRAQFKPTLWTNADGSFRPNDEQIEQVWFPGVHSDVGGSYVEEQLSNITLHWMMHKAEEFGLVFSKNANAPYALPTAADACGPAHDEWKLVPWGLPEHRTVPPKAAISDTVQLRISNGDSHYKPENLTIKDGLLVGYQITNVMPYPGCPPCTVMT